MRKFFTFLLGVFWTLSLQAQVCTVTGSDYATSFIICANDPATESIVFETPPNASGFGYILIIGTNPIIDLTGITIYVPPKIRLVFAGNVIIDNTTTFVTSSGNTQGNSEVQFGINGTVYKGNPGSNGFDVLNERIQNCAVDPNPGECLELNAFLPVELTSFQGKAYQDRVELSWVTAAEINNDHFVVEHSRDGVSFTSVGKVRGAGTTVEVSNYQFLHRLPATGANYYRLKQVDYDGAFTYSDVVVTQVGRPSGNIRIYPNPTVNYAWINFPELPEKIQFSLTNLLGQGIDLQPTPTDAGWQLDLSRMVKGVYLLRMEYDGKTVTRRIVKE